MTEVRMDRAGEMGYDPRQQFPHIEPNQAGVARIGQHEPYSSGMSGGGSSAMMKKNKRTTK
jgi:hypothetical protein